MRFVGDPRDGAKNARLEDLNDEHGIWECTRCYFCNERCPKGVDPRDAIAKLGAESIKEGIDRDMGAKHAKWFVTSAKTTGWLRETELVPKTQGIVESIKQTRFALGLAQARARCRRRSRRTSPRTCASRAGSTTCSTSRTRRGFAGIVQGEKALAKLAHGRHDDARRPVRPGLVPEAVPAEREEAGTRMKQVAYYKGCLASLSAKELDTSTQALAPQVGLELIELESVTCCGAGDIHEAEPDYYLHLNARILAYAAATGSDTLMTVCNVCTLNLRQANFQLMGDAELRDRVNANLVAVGVPAYERDVDVRHLLWELADEEGFPRLAAGGAQGAEGAQDRAVLRLPDPAAVAGARLRGSRRALVARADHRGVRRRGGRLPGEAQVLRLPDHPGARGDGARRADPADRAGDGGRRRRDGDAVPALPPLARRVAVEAARPRRGATSAMPILHLSQLIGVAAGVPESALKFKRHVVPVEPVLEKLER